MSSIIYFLENYNNYYNRIIKRHGSISDYISNSTDYAIRGENLDASVLGSKGPVNFNVNDGITANLTYNYDRNQSWQPDYVVVCDMDSTILSRWFVMEAMRTRRGQYSITLRRDVIADNYNAVIEAPCFIEKATLQTGDNFIFNPENMTYNQIKDPNEVLLKDSSNSAWIVGYVASPQTEEQDTDINIKFSHDVDINYNGTIADFVSSYGGRRYVYDSSKVTISTIVEGETLYNYAYKYECTVDGELCTTAPLGRFANKYKYREKNSGGTTRNNVKNYIRSNNINAYAKTVIESVDTGMEFITAAQKQETWNLNNKLVKTSDSKLYQITVASTENTLNVTSIEIGSQYPSLYNSMINMCETVYQAGHGNENPIEMKIGTFEQIIVTYKEVDGQYITANTKISKNRKELNDAPYCMFCIPYGNIEYFYDSMSKQTVDPVISLAAARTIANTLTQQKCYDLQLLPYCPRHDMIKNGVINPYYNENLVEGYDYNYIYSGENIKTGIIIWCSESSGSLSISHDINIPIDPIEFKVENETTFYRLCSPNNAANFEFKATMNRGVTQFNVDYCYKPYQPYIHINPDFNGLYGVDTNDTRGLICAGDFCLPQTSDQYQSYVLNNKNYQESFNRQIENMDVMHKYQMIDQGVGAIAGSVSAGIGAGISTGNPALGVVAGISSAAAGAADLAISQEKFNETIDYTKDQFGFQLGNVKARPDTLSKVSAYNPNNKIFPFLEKYTCTEQEKEALRNKLYYNGMTVGKISTISNYLTEDFSYIKGKIIRIINTSDDYHNVAAIAEEINKGVFIK